ncbi:MAG TPA: maleylpyruvate isomerase N-terminal domain-containing protein [Candidatus Dormibacteraeota bacterium]
MPRDVRMDAPDPDSRDGLLGSFSASVGRLARAAMGPVGEQPEGWGVREILLHAAAWHDEAGRQLTGTPGAMPEPDAFNAAALEEGAALDFDDVCRRYQRSSSALAGTLAELPEEEFTSDRPTCQWVRGLTKHLTSHAQELESSGAA